MKQKDEFDRAFQNPCFIDVCRVGNLIEIRHLNHLSSRYVLSFTVKNAIDLAHMLLVEASKEEEK